MISFEEENVNTSDRNNLKLSVQDDDYLAAVESGDTETARKMVEEAAEKAGYTPVVRYHQTGTKFNEFSNSNPEAGANDSETPNGYFFKTNDHDIGVGGDYVKTGHGGKMQVYLKADNMLHFLNRKEAAAWYRENVAGYAELGTEKENAYALYQGAVSSPGTAETEKDRRGGLGRSVRRRECDPQGGRIPAHFAGHFRAAAGRV